MSGGEQRYSGVRRRPRGSKEREEREERRRQLRFGNALHQEQEQERGGRAGERPAGGGRDGARAGGGRPGGPPRGRDDRGGGPRGRGGPERGGPKRGRGGPGGARDGRPERRGGGRDDKKTKKVDPEKLARREKAQKLAEDKGIPLSHAHRIVQGRATLNEVLKSLMRKERFERLVEHDGLDRSLAGQVASGHLTKARALQLTEIRRHRKHRLDHDAIKVAERDKKPVALCIFGRGWETGTVKTARVYDFDWLVEGKEPETLYKHDVKAVTTPEVSEGVAEATLVRKDIKEGDELGGTNERAQRVRPSDDELLSAVESGAPHELVLRDGDVLQGEVRSFGRWDAELQVGEANVHVLFHALHPEMKKLSRVKKEGRPNKPPKK